MAKNTSCFYEQCYNTRLFFCRTTPKYPSIAEDFAKTYQTAQRILRLMFFWLHTDRFFDLLKKVEKFRVGAKTNPFIDPQGYQKFVARMTKAFEDKLKAEKNEKK